MKSKNRPKRQQKKPKQEYKKTPRGRKFNPWIYRYFDVKAELKEDKDGWIACTEYFIKSEGYNKEE